MVYQYKAGDRVTVHVNETLYPKLATVNNHICIIKKVMPPYDDFELGRRFELAWSQKDNPGRICDLYMEGVTWYEGEIRPYFNTPKDMIIKDKGLPDI